MAEGTSSSKLASLGSAGLEALLDKLGPELIKALSPTEGLQVTPHTFQAIEQERRWRIDEAYLETHNDGKSKLNTPEPQTSTGYAGNKTKDSKLTASDINNVIDKHIKNMVKKQSEQQTKVPTFYRKRILTINMGAPGLKSSATIDVSFWADGFEIWAGYAGLAKASGFGSLFGNQALIVLNGVTFGNQFPMKYYLTLYGNLNLVGPKFLEFRGAVLVFPNGDLLGLYCETWARDGTNEQSLEFKKNEGYELQL
jgi:hypothetical protein